MLSVLSIPYRGALFLSGCMDIRAIRRQNLSLLRQQAGSVRAIADRVDTDANYLSQLLSENGKHFMGHTMARRLELAFNKPVGWMDQQHSEEESVERDLRDISELARKMNAEQRKNLKNLMDSIVGKPNGNQDTERRVA